MGCRESQWVAMSLHSCGPGRSENSLRMRCADRHADGDHVMNSPWEEERSISRSGSDTAVARATRHILEFVRDVERAGIQVVDLNLGSGLFAAHPSENAVMEAGLPPHCTARRDSVHVARDAMLGARKSQCAADRCALVRSVLLKEVPSAGASYEAHLFLGYMTVNGW